MVQKWMLWGWVRLRLTSADCVGRIRAISRGTVLEQVEFPDALTAEFNVRRGAEKRLSVSEGERLEIIRVGGLPRRLKPLGRWQMVLGAAAFLLCLTMFLSTRILFFRVEGNGPVPARLILERAAECGVYFGASSRELRSEQVKNHLLWAIPELRWAGVNTVGCTAVITVALRESGEAAEKPLPGDITAAVDAVVTEVIPQSGTALVEPGQAVKTGQILISGAADLGHSTRISRAAGEVYGLTRRSVTVTVPEHTVLWEENGEVVRRYSLRIGKKSVNFTNDSGISHGSCVKMRTVNYLTLPGGFQLPAALVTDTYRLCDAQVIPREMSRELLAVQARLAVRAQMTAGTILSEELRFEDGVLTAVFQCRELIGVFRPGIYTEGDTNDRESGERGTG